MQVSSGIAVHAEATNTRTSKLVVQRRKRTLSCDGEDHSWSYAVAMPSELCGAGPNTPSTARRVRSSLEGIKWV